MIYDNKTGQLILAFDTYLENTYDLQNQVAFEPVEKDNFTSDSRQLSPFKINITAVATINNRRAAFNDDTTTVIDVEDKLNELCNGATVVTVILSPMSNSQNPSPDSQFFQYGKTYRDVVLTGFSYQNNPQQLELVANLTFQQIRFSTTQYITTQVVRNPEDTSVVNSGQVQPQAPSTSVLQSIINFLKGLF